MDFETFKENLANDVKEKLYERYGTEVEVGSHRTEKMNETYDALTVKPVDSPIGVNINATALFEGYQDGKSYDEIVDGACGSGWKCTQQHARLRHLCHQ